MSRNYYYFSASLPRLSFAERPPMSDQRFLELASEFLSPRDATAIAQARLIPSPEFDQANSVLRRWHNFEGALRNAIVAYRARKFGLDPRDYYRDDYVPDPFLSTLVAEAAAEEDPLQVDRGIDLARWEMLEEIEIGHYFDLQFLVVYALKLQLLNKWDSIREEKGRAVLDELFSPLKESAQ